MKQIKDIVEASLKTEAKDYVRATVGQLLGEDIKPGQIASVVDDPIYGMNGQQVKVKRLSDANPGFAECELANGSVVTLQTSLLVPV